MTWRDLSRSWSDSVRGVFTILITISQVDVALFGVFVSEITGIYTVRMLLDEKEFITINDKEKLENADIAMPLKYNSA